jgi:hypothetical protein
VSHHEPTKPTDITIPPNSLWAKMPMIGGGLAVVGLGATLAAGMGTGGDRAMFSYLWAFEIFLGLGLAAMGWLFIDHTVKSAWSIVVRRIAETMAVTLPLFALLFIPIVTIGFHSLYPWTHETDAILEKKRWFLSNGPFFTRAALYFIIWSALSWFLYSSSVKQDALGDKPAERDAITKKLWFVAAPGIAIYAVTQSFAAIDWVMSLQPHWYSTIFGVYFFAASIQAFFALMALIAMSLQRAGTLKDTITVEHFHDLGKFTYGFTVFWAYIAFSQFILIWYANIPEETVFYMTRLEGGWNWVSYSLPVAHFFLPFLMLLSRHVKRSRKGLAFAAFWTLGMYLVDMFWLILPNYGTHTEPRHEAVFALSWTDATALVGMGGAFFAAFAFFLNRNKVVAINDPRLPESLVHENF